LAKKKAKQKKTGDIRAVNTKAPGSPKSFVNARKRTTNARKKRRATIAVNDHIETQYKG